MQKVLSIVLITDQISFGYRHIPELNNGVQTITIILRFPRKNDQTPDLCLFFINFEKKFFLKCTEIINFHSLIIPTFQDTSLATTIALKFE